jgi:ABC-type oligopeptide transport system substrate-binding subunit
VPGAGTLLADQAKLVGTRKVEATTKLKGKIFDHEQWEVSADGKTYIYTQRNIGATNPLVVVFHRADAH